MRGVWIAAGFFLAPVIVVLEEPTTRSQRESNASLRLLVALSEIESCPRMAF
jgi:hypothetical protein